MTPHIYLTDTSELQTCWVSLRNIFTTVWGLLFIILHAFPLSMNSQGEWGSVMPWCIVGNTHAVWSLFHQHFSSACQPPENGYLIQDNVRILFVFVKVNVAGISLFALCRAFGSLSHDLLFALFIVFIQLRSINNHRQHRKPQNSLPKRVSHVKGIWGHIIKL